jgi:hypothetical protein
MRRSLRSPILVTLMLFGAGCSRSAPASAPVLDAAPPAPAAPPGETQSLTDLDALEHDLTVSEERLNQYLESRERSRETAIALRDEEARGESKAEKPKSSAGSGGREYAQPPPAAAPRPARKRADDRPADAAEAAPAAPTTAPEPEPVGSACDLACRAFGSMQRSADRICSIAGENDQRCRRARERVADANARISSAQCVCQTDE